MNEKYKAIKKELRTAIAKERQQTMATGGGQPVTPNPILAVPEFMELIEYIRFSACGRPPQYDNDCKAPDEEQLYDIDGMEVEVLDDGGDGYDGVEEDFKGFDDAPRSPLMTHNDPDNDEAATEIGGELLKPEPVASTSAMPIATLVPPNSTPVVPANIAVASTSGDAKPIATLFPGVPKWNKFSGALLRNPMSSPLKRKKPSASDTSNSEAPVDFRQNYFAEQSCFAKERHAKQMANLEMEAELIHLKQRLCKKRLAAANQRQRLKMKILKSELACKMVGHEASEPSLPSTDDSDTSDSDSDVIPPTPTQTNK